MDLMKDWNTYKETEEAQRVIELFEEGSLNDILHTFVKEGASEFPLFEHTIKNVFEYSLIPYDVPIKDLFLYLIDSGLKGYLVASDFVFDIFLAEEYDFLLERMIPTSIGLFGLDREEDNDCYVPYLFYHNFSKLKKIAALSQVEMPPVPTKEQERERVLYYLDFCNVWNTFRKNNNLSMAELCTFLYNFAPQYI